MAVDMVAVDMVAVVEEVDMRVDLAEMQGAEAVKDDAADPGNAYNFLLTFSGRNKFNHMNPHW